jgi:putative phosphonate catabolism associated alcohol dehydrogenase
VTVRAVTPRVVGPPASAGRGVSVYPSATAMVWPGEGHPHEAVAVPGVRLSPGDALVEIELATVCGSDVHTVSGHRDANAPLVLGHEQEYGHERMRRGWELSGGFATHAHILDGTPIVAVPEDIPATVLAPASCATATVVAALEAASAITPLEGALVVVAGAGMLGLTASAMATEAGARVVVSEPDPARRNAALTFGAVAVSDPRAASDSPLGLAAALVRGGGRGAAPTVALELSGATSAVRSLLGAVDVGGVLVLVGSVSPGPELSVDPEQLVRRLLTIRGVHNYAPRHLEQAVQFLAETWMRYPFGAQVGESFPLASVDAALAAAAIGAHPRVALIPRY